MIHADEGGKVDMMYNVEELFIVGLICLIIAGVLLVLNIKCKQLEESTDPLNILSIIIIFFIGLAVVSFVKIVIFQQKCQETSRETYDVCSEEESLFRKEIKYIDDFGEIKTVSYFTMYADDHTHLDKIVYTYKNVYSYDYIYYKKFEKGTDE